MKPYLAILAALALLVMPLVATAQENTPIPPEAHWNSIPPTPKTIDAAKLTQMLVEKGVLTPREQAELLQRPTAGAVVQSQRSVARPNTGAMTTP